jgi:hypothetical protein
VINFLLLFLFPLILATAAMFYFKGKVTIREFLLQTGIVALLILISVACSYWGKTDDVEIWNGKVTGKARNEVSCRHSYSCNCRQVCTGSGQNESCTTVCDTCYEHSYDVDWDVYASTKESVSIDTIDRQGLNMPPRWGAAYVNEPFASRHHFTNYILANPDTVLLGTKGDIEKFKKWIPDYNASVYDYYYHNPVVNMGVPGVDVNVWNWLIREINKELGPTKQVNVNVILVPLNDRSYIIALKDAWKGGKKNDVNVVIGSVDGHTIDFADVVSWSPSGQYKVDIKNRIQDIGTLDKRDDIQQAIMELTKTEFVRLHMKDMKYLVRSFQPSPLAMWIIFILATLAEIGLTYWTVTNEITDDDPDWADKFGNGY